MLIETEQRTLPNLITPNPVTRFAPSPTGYLHLGHVANALYVWGLAERHDGSVLLRIEDHDRQRSRPEYEQAILEDLEWLGLSWCSMVRQSDRDREYQDRLARLAGRFNVYTCSCSRRELAREAADVPGEEMRYPGNCRHRGLPARAGQAIRVEMQAGEIRFNDLLLGEQCQDPATQCGDQQLKDRLGNWTYQFAVTVDDYLQGVNLVIRGQDLLSSTGRQILLGEMLGRPEPAAFLHHPLIFKSDGVKLSKSTGDTGVRELRAAGETRESVLGQAAFLVGLQKDQRPISAGEIGRLFS